MVKADRDKRRLWTRAEDEAFEEAVARVPDGTAERWQRIAEVLPGKSPEEVEQHYLDLVNDIWAIDSGAVPLPNYSDVAEEVEEKVEVVARAEVVRRKGRPWSQEEHKLFLEGLKKYGRGDWRSISRNLVKTKTPTQVASHAQKYFNRLNSKDKGRRSSIHDITLPDPDPDPDPDPNPVSPSTQNPNSLEDDNDATVTRNEPISPITQVSSQMDCSPMSYNNNHLMSPHPISSMGYIDETYITDTININSHLISLQSQFLQQGDPMGYYATNMMSPSTPPPAHFHNMNDYHRGPQISLPNEGVLMGNNYYVNNNRRVLTYVGLPDDRVTVNGAERAASEPDQFPNGLN